MHYILPSIYLLVSIFSFYFSWKGFTTKQVIFKKGVFGTKLENNVALALLQASLSFLLAICTGIFGYIALGAH